MITAVDTSVLLDILTADPRHLESSLRLYRKCWGEGKMILCPIVWAEVRPFFDSEEAMESVFSPMGLSFDDLTQTVASKAGEIWRNYRQKKGPRARLLADFLIAAHALIKADRLLTRDRGFYREYFDTLDLVEP